MSYLPPHFEETDTATLQALVRAHPLATWVVQRWVGKWKVSQNRPAADQQGVAAGLSGLGTQTADQMAALVRQRIKS